MNSKIIDRIVHIRSDPSNSDYAVRNLYYSKSNYGSEYCVIWNLFASGAPREEIEAMTHEEGIAYLYLFCKDN